MIYIYRIFIVVSYILNDHIHHIDGQKNCKIKKLKLKHHSYDYRDVICNTNTLMILQFESKY